MVLSSTAGHSLNILTEGSLQEGSVRRLPPTSSRETASNREPDTGDTGEDIRVIENYLLETCIRYPSHTPHSLHSADGLTRLQVRRVDGLGHAPEPHGRGAGQGRHVQIPTATLCSLTHSPNVGHTLPA